MRGFLKRWTSLIENLKWGTSWWTLCLRCFNPSPPSIAVSQLASTLVTWTGKLRQGLTRGYVCVSLFAARAPRGAQDMNEDNRCEDLSLRTLWQLLARLLEIDLSLRVLVSTACALLQKIPLAPQETEELTSWQEEHLEYVCFTTIFSKTCLSNSCFLALK